MSDALDNFDELKSLVDQLDDAHGKIQQGPGRRHNQEALHRSGVVMTVAAWESYVEDVINEAMQALAPAAGAGPGERTSWALAKAATTAATKKLNTPNPSNVGMLFETHLGFEVKQHWGVIVDTTQYTTNTAVARMNAWMNIRHAVAHGRPLPADMPWIQSPSGKPRLTLALMRDCRDFFEALAIATDDALAAYLVAEFGLLASPW